MIATDDAPATAPAPVAGGSSVASTVERYVTGWVFAGILATALVLLTTEVGQELADATGRDLLVMAGLVLLSGLAFRFAVPFRYGRAVQSVDLSEAALVAVFVVLPGGCAFVVAGLGLAGAVISRRGGAAKTGFNVSVALVSLAAAVVVRDVLIGPAAPLSDRGLVAVALALLVYGGTAFLAVSGVIARLEREHLLTIVHRRRYVFPSTIGNIAIGTMGVVLWSVRPEMIVLVAVPLVATTLAYRGASTANDLADRMRAEHDRLDRVVSSTTDGIALVGPDGRVVLWNPSLERLTSLDAATAEGAHLSHVLPLRDERDHRALDPAALLSVSEPGAPPVIVDAELVDPESTEVRTVRISVTAVEDDTGAPGGLVVVRDISREREVERLKDDFLMRVSHELRTPLTPIKGYAETLLIHGDRVTPELLRRSLVPISERADHMASLVDDLLLVASIQRGGGLAREVITTPADVGARVEQLGPSLARDREVRVTDRATRRAQVDAGRFDRILSILLDNAVTYSEDGTAIDLVVRDAGPHVVVDVVDRGRGIPRSHLHRIFERFHRVEDPLLMETGGLGIGLHIAQHLARSMGGEITVRSVLGEGSTFSLHLPRESASLQRSGTSPDHAPG